tara:strand:+ start:178 stop:642 length:465 start_codon:yes stop_codon:yes gene_type:complete
MNLLLTPDNYNINYIYFNDSIKNTVIDNSNFIKIMFSNTDLYLNGFYVLITLENISVEKYYNKYKCVINDDNTNNKNIFQFMYKLEHELLHKYNNIKNKKLIITNQLKQNNIKLFIENKNIKETMYSKLQFCLKISGIWEKNDEIGLTYKFTII